MKLTSNAIEVVNRNALVTVALNQGYNAYLPVYDNGIDLIISNESGDTRHVQLKGRWTIDKKYIGRNIYIAFPDRETWYVVPHDVMQRLGERHTASESWKKGSYSKSSLSKADREELADYKFGEAGPVIQMAEKQAE